MRNKFGKTIVSGLALAFVICVAASANAASYYAAGTTIPATAAANCGVTATAATHFYATIGAAVTAAPAGGTVQVCPGTYPEQVGIEKNLTLKGITATIAGQGANQAVITAPSGGIVANTTSLSSGYPIAAQIWVHDATAVSISDVVVDGSGNNGLTYCGAPNLIGIYYQDASGTVNRVVTRNQTSVPPNGCQSGAGLGIYVQSGDDAAHPTGGTSTLTVENSSVHDFQKNGITGNEPGTALTVTGNEVRGQGPTTTGAAENGIQFGFGATGKATSNMVIDEIWALDTSSDTGDAAAGILVYDSAGVTVSSNHVGNTQFGIAVVGDGSSPANDATISSNVLDGTLIFDAIEVCGSTGGTITGNTVTGSTESGIHLDGTCNSPAPTTSVATVSGNYINEACAGILNGVSQTVGANTFFNVANTILAGVDTCTLPGPNGDASRALTAGSKIGGRPQPARL